jgi:RHS repeat-associated protein
LTSAGGVAYTWDDRGNLTGDGTFTYTYNAAGRLVQAQSVTSTLVYTYTAGGLRVGQSDSSVPSVDTYAWDWASGLPEMLSEGGLAMGEPIALYLVGHETLGQWDGASWTYYLPDGLGSVRQVTDEAGAVIDAREWTPYGVEVGAAQVGLGYTGEWQDSALGMTYLRARWYDSYAGRFTRRDPLSDFVGVGQGQSDFAYADDDPVNGVDPMGLFTNPTIARSFGFSGDKRGFEQVISLFYTNERWGWLKLLQDARVGSKVFLSARGANPPHWKRVFEGEFRCNKGRIELEGTGSPLDIFWSADTIEEDISSFTSRLSMPANPLILWRDTTPRWYSLYVPGCGGVIRDYGDGPDRATRDLPDFVSGNVSVGPKPIAPFEGGLSFVTDLYGQQYLVGFLGVSWGPLPVDLTYSEGYIDGYLSPQEYHDTLTGWGGFSAQASLVELFGISPGAPISTEKGFGLTAGVSVGISGGIELPGKVFGWDHMVRKSSPPPGYWSWDISNGSMDYYFDKWADPCECQ